MRNPIGQSTAPELRAHRLRAYLGRPPAAEALAAALALVRALSGALGGYGAPAGTWLAFAAAALFGSAALLALKRGRRGSDSAAPADSTRVFLVPRPALSLEPAYPFVAAAAILALDAWALRSPSALPWAVAVVAAAAFAPGGVAFLVSALPAAAAGVACAFLAPDRAAGNLAALGSAALAAAFLYADRRAEARRSFMAAAARIEREHALSSMRDAEVEIAARIQRSLLLDVPASAAAGYRLEAITVASNAVDGDFYGFVPYKSESVDILIGDVMGKGVPAALLGAALKGAFLRSSLRLLVERAGTLPNLEDLVSAVHETVAEKLSDLESFATLQYARVDSRLRRMDFVDCGHTPILHWDAALGVCWSVKGRDLPLGFSEEKDYTRFTIPLSAGDRLVFYSDGITEAMNSSGELFGDARLSAIVSSNAVLDPAELIRRIINTAMYFTAAVGFRDDVTCIALSVDPREDAPRRSAREFPADLESLSAVRAFLSAELSADGIPPESSDLAARVLLSVSEAVSNAIRYGTPPAAADLPADRPAGAGAEAPDEADELEAEDGPVSDRALLVEYRSASSWTAVRIVYRGKDFPWHRAAPEVGIEGFPSGGLGRSIMARTSDSVLHAAGPCCLRAVCLVFDAHEPSADPSPL